MRLLISNDRILFQNKVFLSPPTSKMQLLTLSTVSKTLIIKFHEWNLLYSSWQFDYFKIIQCLRASFHQSLVSVIFANQFKFLIKTVGSVITLNSRSFFNFWVHCGKSWFFLCFEHYGCCLSNHMIINSILCYIQGKFLEILFYKAS